MIPNYATEHMAGSILLVVFVASLIRSTSGFGEALIAVPLLSLFMPIEIASPLAVLLSITIAAVVVVQDWRKIHIRSASWLLAPSFVGIPLGLALLTRADQHFVKALLAIVILMFSGYFLFRANAPELRGDSRAWLLGYGFLAGILGGAYGMNGPPLVIYGALRRWTPQYFRATLQAYFLPASILGMAGYWFAGLWIVQVTHFYVISLAVAIPATFLCRAMNHRFCNEAFLKYLYLGLAFIGLVLLFQAVRRA